MMLQIEHLKIAFPNPKGHFEAVKDFSLHVEEGQVIGIVGESGSGKSMTAHAIMGLLDRKSVQVSGSIRFEGVELLDLTRSQMRSYQGKDLSIIFQEPMTSLNPTMKIGPQVEEALRGCQKDITVAVMGCAVNGPGEAREADVGIAGGEGEGLLFKKGKIVKKVPEDQLLAALLEEVDKL